MYAYKYILLYMLKLNLIHKYIITFELDLGFFFFFNYKRELELN